MFLAEMANACVQGMRGYWPEVRTAILCLQSSKSRFFLDGWPPCPRVVPGGAVLHHP